MIEKNDLFSWAEAHADEQLALLKELAAIPTPSHQEQQRVEFICRWLKNLGVDDVVVDEAQNILIPFGCKGRDDITVYMAHTDVVFPDLTPLPVREEAGKLYAPGVGDDTANVVSLMLCVKYILEHRAVAREPVLVVFNSCEEGLGNLKGVRQIMNRYSGRVKELISFDAGFKRICNRAVGSERWKVSVKTKGGHSYGAFGNPNAIVCLAELITKLSRQSVPEIPGRKTTYNVGTISGGTSVNTIAQDAEMLYEYRSDDKAGMEQMREQFFALLDEAQQSMDAVFEKTLLGERPCGVDLATELHPPLIDRSTAAITAVTGIMPGTYAASTDANIPLAMGIPAVTFGLYTGVGAHTREENLDIDSLLPGLEIGLLMVLHHFDFSIEK